MRIRGFADFVKTKNEVEVCQFCPSGNNKFSERRVDVEIIFMAEISRGEFAEVYLVKNRLVGAGQEGEMDNESQNRKNNE